MGSSEQLPDSDSEQDESAKPGGAEVADEDEQLNYQDSLELDGTPPPPNDDANCVVEGSLITSLAELNVNQSNNYYYCSPSRGSRVLLERLRSKKMLLSRNRAKGPEFV